MGAGSKGELKPSATESGWNRKEASEEGGGGARVETDSGLWVAISLGNLKAKMLCVSVCGG